MFYKNVCFSTCYITPYILDSSYQTCVHLQHANLFVRSFPDIEHFPSKWEDTITIPADHTQARHSQCLG